MVHLKTKSFVFLLVTSMTFLVIFKYSFSNVFVQRDCNCDSKQEILKILQNIVSGSQQSVNNTKIQSLVLMSSEHQKPPQPKGKENRSEFASLNHVNNTKIERPGLTSLEEQKQSIHSGPPQPTGKENWSEIATMYHDYVNSIQLKCNSIVRAGAKEDGGWDICDDEPFRIKKPCTVYSFGINDDWTFDDAIAEKYGCHVYAFDPSMKQNDHNRSALIHFYKLGLAEREYTNSMGWKLNTLAGIRNKLGHSKTKLDILKMDIEKTELTCLPDMVKSGALRDVTQFVFEIHIRISMSSESEADTVKYKLGLHILKLVYDEGFRIFRTHKNPWSKYISMNGLTRYGCHELHMVRVT